MSVDWAKSGAFLKIMKKFRLLPEELLRSQDLKDFWVASSPILGKGCRRHSLMYLAKLKKNGKLPDWRQDILAFNADESANRITSGTKAFPCVLPRRVHVLAIRGSMMKADGKTCLAMLGFQPNELEAFPTLSQLPSRRQQDLAGNAFAANTCAAYILALAVVR
jgi:hypothetical protein